MTMTPKTTHAAEAASRLLQQFKGQARFEGVVAALAAQTQADEDVLAQLLEDLWLGEAVGAQLDGIGDIVGEPRGGKVDATYEIYLWARILVNLSSGTADELLAIAQLLVDDTDIDELEEYPAGMTLRCNVPVMVGADAIADLLGEAKAGGVALRFEYFTCDADDVLRCDIGPGLDVGLFATALGG